MTDGRAGGVEARAEPGFARTLADLYFSPAEGFAAVVARRRFWLAFALLMAVNALTVGVWLGQVDRREFLKVQLEEYGVWEKIPPEGRAQALDTTGFDRNAWLGSLLGGTVFLAAAAGVYLFLFRFFLASDVDFRQSLAVVTHSFLAVGLVKWPLALLTLELKGDWNVAPELALQASLAAFFDKGAVARPLWALADSMDLFLFWTLYLLASGYRAAGRHGLTTALVTVAIPWALLVVLKVAFFSLV